MDKQMAQIVEGPWSVVKAETPTRMMDFWWKSETDYCTDQLYWQLRSSPHSCTPCEYSFCTSGVPIPNCLVKTAGAVSQGWSPQSSAPAHTVHTTDCIKGTLSSQNHCVSPFCNSLSSEHCSERGQDEDLAFPAAVAVRRSQETSLRGILALNRLPLQCPSYHMQCPHRLDRVNYNST